MKKYIWLLILMMLTVMFSGCSLWQQQQPINYITDTITLPTQASIYPNPDKMTVIEEAFSAPEMEWTENELESIALYRNSIKGLFWYLQQEADLNAVPLYKAKNTIEQGRAYYKGLKAILSTRRIKLSMRDGIIYDDAVTECDRILKEVSYSLTLREAALNSSTSSFDIASLLSAWGAISPFVGGDSTDLSSILGVIQ